MIFRTIAIVALAGFVSVNSFSIGCVDTFVRLAQDVQVVTCLRPALFLPILFGNGPESMIDFLDTWLASMCGSPACSNDTLNMVLDSINKGCPALNSTQPVFDMVRGDYNALRTAVCLKDGVNCLTATLRNIESLTGAMNLDEHNILRIVELFRNGLPPAILCTNCVKGMYTTLKKEIPESFSDSDAKYAENTCGASFVDGGIPPGLIASASQSTAIQSPSAIAHPAHTPTPTPASTTSPTPIPSSVNKNAAIGAPYLSPSVVVAVSGLVLVAVGAF